MKASGLRVNDPKTEVCLFSRSDVASMDIIINDETIKNSKAINVLGIVFDSKLQWGPQVKKDTLMGIKSSKCNKAY